MQRRGLTGLLMLVIVVAITMIWWALALWPAGDAPTWLERTRLVCFGTEANGLPDAAGWTALILQPTLMLASVAVIWGRSVTDGMRLLNQHVVGRACLRTMGVVILVAASAATWRVANAVNSAQPALLEERGGPAAETYPRLKRPAPELGLVDQHGDTVTLERFSGHVTLVTFAFAHCETVCPAIVRDVLAARRQLSSYTSVSVIVVTLDPWRDTPSRLPHIARTWDLGNGEHVVSGTVESVERTLDAWDVPRQRDRRSGDVSHPVLAYVVDRHGRIAYASPGGSQTLVDLVARL